METVRDRFWIWGHQAGSHEGYFKPPRKSRITPVEGAAYLDIPNMIFIRYGELARPYDQYAVPFRALDKVVWSITGGADGADEREHVYDLARQHPNFVGVMMDDFFHGKPTPEGEIAYLSRDELKEVRRRLHIDDRTLDLWVVIYTHQLDLPVKEHLALCDTVTLWTWKSEDLKDLEANLARLEQLAPDKKKVLGCYMYDYGVGQPMPLDRMQQQCKTGLRWLKEGRIDGMIFLASCICDLELEAVEWTRRWIAEVGDEPLP